MLGNLFGLFRAEPSPNLATMIKIHSFELRTQPTYMSPTHGDLEIADFHKIAELFPDFVIWREPPACSSFKVKLPAHDLRLAEMLGFIESELGLKSVWTQSEYLTRKDHHWFDVETNYEFDKHDLDNAPFLEMFSLRRMGQDILSEDHDHYVLLRAAKKTPFIGSVGTIGTQFCTAEARAELEKEQFVGLKFLPVDVRDPACKAEDFWQIWADRSMPRLRMKLVDLRGNEIIDDFSNGCYTDEISPQRVLRYGKSDLNQMKGVDFALTSESWGKMPDLLVSQQVRQWCLKNKLKINWTPVLALSE